MTSPDSSESLDEQAFDTTNGLGRPVWVVAAGVLAAIGASTCCVIPFALFTLGISGAWIGNLTALAPYQPIFIGLTLAFLGTGFVMVYRKPKAAVCADGTYCARPKWRRLSQVGLWAATALVAVSLAWPYLLPLILGSR